MVQPDRDVGADAAGALWVAAKSRRLVGLDFAIGQAAGEPEVQGHAQGIEVAHRVGLGGRSGTRTRWAGLGSVPPLLRVHVAGGAGTQLADCRRLAAGDGRAQVEQTPAAIVTEVQVGGFDIAVDHALAVQQAQRAGDGDCALHHLVETEAAFGGQHLLQRLAAVPVEDDVKAARLG